MQTNSAVNPRGFRWVLELIFGHGFWQGFSVALFLSPILMMLISFAWSGSTPTWDEHFKSFIIGDPLLAVVVGFLAWLNGRPAQREYKLGAYYWYKWLGVGALASALFITNDIRKGVLEWMQLLQPHLFYHHILLIILFVALLGGMGYAQYRRHPGSKVWFVIVALLLGYIGLCIFDTLNPPLGSIPRI